MVGELRTVTLISRPKKIKSDTHRIITSCGSLYITVGMIDKKPIEVFIAMGKAGNCETSQNASLGIAISVALQHGVPLVVFAENLRGVRCHKPKMFPPSERVLSCADAVSGVLFQYVDKE